MEKVKVTKEVFDALEAYKHHGKGDLLSELEYTAMKFTEKDWVHYKAFNTIDLKMFLDCAYYGYEAELSPEEKILNFYNLYKKENNDFATGVLFGVREVLRFKNCVITGVNKEV